MRDSPIAATCSRAADIHSCVIDQLVSARRRRRHRRGKPDSGSNEVKKLHTFLGCYLIHHRQHRRRAANRLIFTVTPRLTLSSDRSVSLRPPFPIRKSIRNAIIKYRALIYPNVLLIETIFSSLAPLCSARARACTWAPVCRWLLGALKLFTFERKPPVSERIN